MAMDLALPPVIIDKDIRLDNFNTSRSLAVGDMAVAEGLELRGWYLIFAVTVQAAAAKVNGLTLAQQDALLASILFDLKTGPVDASANFHAFQDRPLTYMRLRQLKDFETELDGYGAALGKGLSKALAVGSNELYFILRVSLGHVESIDENALFAAGSEQAAMMAPRVWAKGDPLKALDADLEAKGLYVRFGPDFRVAPEGDSGKRLSRFGITPISREHKENAQRSITVKSLLPIDVVDLAKPTATNDFKGIRVEVGGTPVTTGDATPKDVEAAYASHPDTNAAEKAVAAKVTRLFAVHDMPLKQMLTGELTVSQVEQSTVFDAMSHYIPTLLEREAWLAMKAHVARLAKVSGNDSLTVRLISPVAVHEDVKVEDRFLAALGWYATREGDTEWATVPSLEWKNGTELPKLHIPPQLLAAKYGQWVTALVMGDKATMRIIVQSMCRTVPFATLGAAGWAAGEGWVVAMMKFRLRELLEASSPKLLPTLDALAY